MSVVINGTSGVQLPLGSASAPAETNTTAQTTGIYYPSSTTLGLTTNGTNALYIDASQNVGIGTASPGQKLQVNVSSATAYSSGVSGNGLLVYNTSATNGQYVGITFQGEPTTGNAGQATILGTTTSGGNMDLTFSTRGSSTLAERMRIDSSGNLLVGKTSSSNANIGFEARPAGGVFATCSDSTSGTTTYHVYSTGAGAYRFYVGLQGQVYATNTTITAISDQRLKENIQDLDVGLDAIMALKPRKFDWKTGKGKDKKGDRGWIAQEFEQVFPDMIDTWKDPAPEGEEPYKAVNADLIPVLVKAIQEQQAQITSLKAELDALKGTK